MTDKPFQEALPELLAERDWTIRELSRQTRKNRKRGLSHGAIGAMQRGDLPPTKESLEVMAAALMVPAKHFAEWRLEDKRERLNWRHRGVRRALRELEK